MNLQTSSILDKFRKKHWPGVWIKKSKNETLSLILITTRSQIVCKNNVSHQHLSQLKTAHM